jgi:phosphoglycerate kinase
MAARTLAELDLDGRRALVRVDFDVPLTPARGIADGRRLHESLPTIRQLLAGGARVVLAAHLGRPGGRPHPEFSLEPVGAYLADLLGQEVVLADEPAGDGARKVISDLRPGGVAMLENLRFSPGEESNDERFARALASYADVYVNDSLAVSHLPHASVAAVPRLVAQRGMGLGLERDVRALGLLQGEVQRPFVAVVGGGRVAERVAALEALLPRVDAFYFGGAVANTFLKARGGSGSSVVGRSLVDEDRLAWARSFLTRAQARDVSIFLPRDLMVAAGTRSPTGRVVAAQRVPEDLAAMDIGPETSTAFTDGIVQARTVFWNGTMGVFEAEPFSLGTLAIARAVGGTRGALTVVAGADCAAAVARAQVGPRIDHITTAGVAALALIEGRKLPGLTALEN